MARRLGQRGRLHARARSLTPRVRRPGRSNIRPPPSNPPPRRDAAPSSRSSRSHEAQFSPGVRPVESLLTSAATHCATWQSSHDRVAAHSREGVRRHAGVGIGARSARMGRAFSYCCGPCGLGRCLRLGLGRAFGPAARVGSARASYTVPQRLGMPDRGVCDLN